MFEKFTEKAKRILFLARYEASQQGEKQIGSEHLLLGLLKEGEETTRELFTRANVSMDMLQAELERRGPVREKLSTSVEIPFSEETKKILQYAEEESERLMHPNIGTEHILLGLLRLEDSPAGRMLNERGMRLYRVPVPHDAPRLTTLVADLLMPFLTDQEPLDAGLARCRCAPVAFCTNGDRDLQY